MADTPTLVVFLLVSFVLLVTPSGRALVDMRTRPASNTDGKAPGLMG